MDDSASEGSDFELPSSDFDMDSDIRSNDIMNPNSDTGHDLELVIRRPVILIAIKMGKDGHR